MAIGGLGKATNQILIRISGDSKQLQAELNKSESAVDAFAARLKSKAPLIGAAFAGMAVGLAAYSANAAMNYEQLSRGFHKLTASQGKDADLYIKKLKEMSHGTITETEIMANANKAMLLGIDIETIAQMMEGAAVIAQATGQDVGYMFESLALGIGRQSRMLLDNLGIIVKVEEANLSYAQSIGKTVSQLTAEEQKTAFLTAAMDGLKERTESLGGYTEDTRSEWDKLKTTFSEISTTLGSDLLPPVNSLLNSFNDWLDSGGSDKIVQAFRDIGEWVMYLSDPQMYTLNYNVREAWSYPRREDLDKTIEDALYNGDPTKKGEQDGALYGAGFQSGMSKAMRAAEKGVSMREFAMGGTLGSRGGYLSPEEFAQKYDTEFTRELSKAFSASRSGI